MKFNKLYESIIKNIDEKCVELNESITELDLQRIV